ncbi:hypothetical protein BDB00DRAFT_867816 [Zychaea mexicana]|uniref:uncharacterized protein n=1 Tax=Zychaea mexicana TaxID=64656 RepID=UPI0022FEE4D0|nr:uncharacterized protein BDB00DRAFT_867816 [Zychaea mexicana]KAI9498165.1 hypothetical protein BDB00DRAFT_867816 [Zychaea mexicana]
MYASALQRHNIVLVIVLLTLLFSLTYFRHATYKFETPLPVNDLQPPPPLQQQQQQQPHRVNASPPPPSWKYTEGNSSEAICSNVDFTWLVSDREHWDGWVSKAMFMKPEGNYTSKDVTIAAGDSVCVVVMLGPIPAVSAIRPEQHFAPADSITIHAVGDMVKVPITLEQHDKHSNVYYSSVYFAHPDVYQLESTTEYRSYFWETPIYHPYRPFHYTSHNSLIVNAAAGIDKSLKPSCNGYISTGSSWINKTEYQRLHPLDFYGMFGDAQEDHVVDDRLFVPDQCRMDYISTSQAIQCLEGKTFHVWGDNNMKRNLKAFSTPSWCSEKPTSNDDSSSNDEGQPRCICNDDSEGDNDVWGTDTNEPLLIRDTWHDDIAFHFNPIGSITLDDWQDRVKQRISELPRANIVLLSLGNDDIPLSRMTPRQFWNSFMELTSFLLNEIYSDQTIIVRTPQYFCCGNVHGTSWNSGRSRAFATVIRQAVKLLASERSNVLLWDVHRLGMEDNTCVASGSAYTKRSVVNIENLLLWNLMCPAASSSSPPS